MEHRSHRSQPQQLNPTKVKGYAAAFNIPATIRDVGGREFRETISPAAFNRTLTEQPDIRLLRDHDPSSLLARTKSGTLRVGTDAYGLWFDADLPDTTEARDLVTSLQRGDLDACSFGFTVKEDQWTRGDIPTRELRDVALFEVSIVAFPAYDKGTTVDLRSVITEAPKTPWRKNKARLFLSLKS